MNAQHDSTDSHNSYPQAKRLIILAGAILTSLMVGFLAYDSWVDYRRTLESAEQRLTSYRIALAEHARTTFNSAQWVLDQAYAYLDHRNLADFSEWELGQTMQSFIQHFPQIGWINIMNADAVSVANTAVYPVDKTPLTYRDYMQFHQQNISTDILFFSKPEIGALTKRWRFFITRRLSHSDGSLAGVIGCAFDPTYYDAFYQRLDLGRTGRFLLIRNDGQILVQSPFAKEAMNTNLSNPLLFTRELPRSPSGVFRNPTTGFDASDRIISYQRVEQFPIIATVSMTYAEIIGPWRQRTLAKVVVALVPLLAAAWLGFVLAQSLAQRERAAKALAESERKFRAIFDHAPYGIAITNLDGQYLDVNQACAETLGFSQEEMLSRPASATHVAEEEVAAIILEGLKRHGVVKNFEATVKHRNESLLHVLYSSVLVQIQGEARILSILVDITDQKRVEAALQQSEATLRSLFSAVPVGLLIIQDRVLRSVNERFCEIAGYSREALVGQDSRLFYETNEEFERVGHAVYDRLWETGLSYVETRLRRADGTYRDASLHAAPLQPSDRSAGIALAIQDITERKQSEAMLRSLFNAAPVGLLILQDRVLCSVNERFCEIVDYPRLALEGYSSRQLYESEEEFQRVGHALYDRLWETGLSYVEARFRRPDGTYRDVSLHAAPLQPDDRSAGAAVAVQDITEYKRAEETLQLNELRMATLLELSRMPSASEKTVTDFALKKAVDLSRSDLGYLAFTNEDESVLTMYSWSKSAMEQCAVEDQPVVYPVATTGLWGEAIRQRQPIITNDYQAPNPWKKSYPPGHVELSRHMNIPLFDGDRIVLLVGVGNKLEPYDETDIDQLTLLMDGMWKIIKQKRAEAELQRYQEHLEERVAERTAALQHTNAELRHAMNQLAQSEKLAALGALVAGIAHELNTPIGNAVLTASTLAGQERGFTAQIPAGLTRSALQQFVATVREGSEILQRNLQRAAELISSFKQVAVDQASYQRRAFALEEVVHEIALALSPTLRRSPATLAVTVDPGLQLDSFPGPLGQVLMNLISNALVHAFAGRERGVIRIESMPAAPGRIGLRVSDDGNGIAPAHLSRLFDPFFTTRLGQGGSGLGLHIVYNLVTGLLGGTITVHSIPGQGATFDLELPLLAPPAAPPPGETRAEADSSAASY